MNCNKIFSQDAERPADPLKTISSKVKCKYNGK